MMGNAPTVDGFFKFADKHKVNGYPFKLKAWLGYVWRTRSIQKIPYFRVRCFFKCPPGTHINYAIYFIHILVNYCCNMKILTGSSNFTTPSLTYWPRSVLSNFTDTGLSHRCFCYCLSAMERKVAREFRHKVRLKHFLSKYWLNVTLNSH